MGAASYNWNVSTGAAINTSNANNLTVNFGGTYATGNITVSAVNNCGAGATRSLTVKATPAIPGAITGAVSACINGQQNYSIATVQGASNYTWTVPTGSIINSGQGSKTIDMNFGPAISANGIVTVKATNTCGTSTAKVLGVVTNICVRLDNQTTSFVVYPNPAHGQFNVSFNAEEAHQSRITLMDASGRIIIDQNVEAASGENNYNFDVTNVASGIYLLQLQSQNSIEKTKIIID